MLRDDLQNELDDRLVRLLESLRRKSPYGDIAAEARRILDAYTADPSDTRVSTGGEKLLSANWESHWEHVRGMGLPANGRFFGSPADDPDYKAGHDLYLAFVQMMDLVKEADTPRREAETMADLQNALADYLSRRRKLTDMSVETDAVACYVGLLQMAAIVNRSKRTLERFRDDGGLPPPAVKGGQGKPDEWVWQDVRQPLEAKYGKSLPERFPADKFVGR